MHQVYDPGQDTPASPAEQLRAAAAKIRAAAKAAHAAPWRSVWDELGRGWDIWSALSGHIAFGLAEGDAAWAALAHPGIAEPLAAMFDAAADHFEPLPAIWRLLDLARVITGSRP